MLIIKKFIQIFLNSISKVIFQLVPFYYRNKTFDLYQEHINKNLKESYAYFEKHFDKCVLFKDVFSIQEYAIKNALSNDTEQKMIYLEFGVHTGVSANFFSRYIKKLYGFDSFEGLNEDIYGGFDQPKGTFNLDRQIPYVHKNVELVIGLVEKTLDDWLIKHNSKINFIHLDLNSHEATKFVLSKVKPYLAKGGIIIIDEFHNYPGWKVGDFKAFTETFNENEYFFKSFNLTGSQVVIEKN